MPTVRRAVSLGEIHQPAKALSATDNEDPVITRLL